MTYPISLTSESPPSMIVCAKKLIPAMGIIIPHVHAHCCTQGAGAPPENCSDPSTAMFYPSATDYTLQQGDVWFWEPALQDSGTQELRKFDELIYTYHQTVGKSMCRACAEHVLIMCCACVDHGLTMC